MYFIYGVIFIIFGILSIKYPVKMLEFEHYFKVKRGTEFTEFAKRMTVFGGVMLLITGVGLIIFTIASL